MKLLTCEYNGRTFAAVSDGKMVYEAAPDMYALIKALDGKLPGADMLAARGPPSTGSACSLPFRSRTRTSSAWA